jgi:hypothetical protein
MKRPRLRTLVVAGTLAAATLTLAAPHASAKPIEDFAGECRSQHGQLDNLWHYNFDVNGNPAGAQLVTVCRVGNVIMWNDTDDMGNDY